MKQILVVLLLMVGLESVAQKKWNYKAGLVTPIPFYLQTPYTVDLSSALVQARYSLNEKLKLSASTGYIRLRPNDPEYDIFSSVPVMFGATYDISNSFYVGLNAGPSLITEIDDAPQKIRAIYSPYVGTQLGKWSIDLVYFNWEEVMDEVNSLTICVSYNF